VATCEANGVNPVEYLRDVLLRISKRRLALDDLLPHRWTRPKNACEEPLERES